MPFHGGSNERLDIPACRTLRAMTLPGFYGGNGAEGVGFKGVSGTR